MAKNKGSKKGKPVTQADVTEGANVGVDNAAPATVASGSTTETPETTGSGAAGAAGGSTIMEDKTITLTKSTSPIKSTRIVLFGGPLKTVQFLATAFPKDGNGGRIIPDTITVVGAFADPTVPKAKETPEERKARLAALPKLTPAEKLARAKERLAKLEAKVAKEQAGA